MLIRMGVIVPVTSVSRGSGSDSESASSSSAWAVIKPVLLAGIRVIDLVVVVRVVMIILLSLFVLLLPL